MDPALTSLSNQSAVLVEAKLEVQKNIGPDDTVSCNVNILESG